MKYKHIVFPTILITAVTLVGCENRNGLATKVGGTWQSAPEEIVNTDSMSVSMIKSFEFVPDGDAEGTLIISAMLLVEKYMAERDSIIATITVNAAAVASITGRYEAISYDKIALVPDDSTLSLSIDSAAVSYDYSVVDNNAAPDLTNFKQRWATDFQKYLTPIVKANFMQCDTLHVVKLTDTMMYCHDDKNELTLRLQTPQQ